MTCPITGLVLHYMNAPVRLAPIDGEAVVETELFKAVRAMGVALGASEGALAALTCGEVDSVIRVLAVAGLVDDAATLVVGHAIGDGDSMDDEGDAHWSVAELFDNSVGAGTREQYDAARAYVLRLTPAVCRKCGKPIVFDSRQEDWTAHDGTACGGDVVLDGMGDPIIGHHEPA